MDLFERVSTVDTGERSANDFYETPPFMVRSLLHFHPAIAGATVLECCAGRGAIARILREEFGCTVYTNDIDQRHDAETSFDATNSAYWIRHAPPVDYVITNPAFNSAIWILQHAVLHARRGVGFLLRKTFLEPTDDRGPWLSQNPPTRGIGEPRYSFRGKGNDSVSCDWYLWEKERDLSLPPFVVDFAAERRLR